MGQPVEVVTAQPGTLGNETCHLCILFGTIDHGQVPRLSPVVRQGLRLVPGILINSNVVIPSFQFPHLSQTVFIMCIRGKDLQADVVLIHIELVIPRIDLGEYGPSLDVIPVIPVAPFKDLPASGMGYPITSCKGSRFGRAQQILPCIIVIESAVIGHVTRITPIPVLGLPWHLHGPV